MAPDLPMFRVVTQRGEGDCAIACLAMLTGVTYEDALEVMTHIAPGAHRRGAWNTHILEAAARLGCPLTKHRSARFAQMVNDTQYYEQTAIISGVLPAGRKRYGHVVVLRWGLVFDPDGGTVWEPDVYLCARRFDVRSVLSKAS